MVAVAHQGLYDLGRRAAPRLASALQRCVAPRHRDMILFTLYELRYVARDDARGAFLRALGFNGDPEMRQWAQAFLARHRAKEVQAAAAALQDCRHEAKLSPGREIPPAQAAPTRIISAQDDRFEPEASHGAQPALAETLLSIDPKAVRHATRRFPSWKQGVANKLVARRWLSPWPVRSGSFSVSIRSPTRRCRRGPCLDPVGQPELPARAGQGWVRPHAWKDDLGLQRSKFNAPDPSPACGDNEVWSGGQQSVVGPSPRLWGQLEQPRTESQHTRSITTAVGT